MSYEVVLLVISFYLFNLLKPFSVGGKLVGYVKKVGNLRHVVLRDAGHSAPRYQPEAALEMLQDFLRNGYPGCFAHLLLVYTGALISQILK